jgi:hypothetical protein
MRSFPMPLIALSAALLLSACAEQKSEEAAADQNANAESVGPAISGAAAPGVAFRYDYAFTLPGQSISQVQQQHAAACQNLGPSRCRVTGIAYDQPGEDQVSARLDLLLAPDLAHRYANEGIAAVERAEGKLDNAHVTGENAGDAILLSQSDSAANEAEIARLEARLAAKRRAGRTAPTGRGTARTTARPGAGSQSQGSLYRQHPGGVQLCQREYPERQGHFRQGSGCELVKCPEPAGFCHSAAWRRPALAAAGWGNRPAVALCRAYPLTEAAFRRTRTLAQRVGRVPCAGVPLSAGAGVFASTPRSGFSTKLSTRPGQAPESCDIRFQSTLRREVGPGSLTES